MLQIHLVGRSCASHCPTGVFTMETRRSRNPSSKWGQPADQISCRAAAFVCFVLIGLAGCAVNPVTGERELALISEEEEVQLGREADQEIVSTLGLYEDERWQNYVQELGERMALDSERPDLPWTFRVVDDPVVNAFALPGGYIYLTRGILAHFGSEAELAGVLGHEIGHVTARHSVQQISRAQLAQLGLGLGTLLLPELETWVGAAGVGLQLLLLSYSRDAEREADDLGLRYMADLNYDPTEMAATATPPSASVASAAWVWRRALWRAVTWPISWPSRAASSDSSLRSTKMPRVQAMVPPGKV